MALNNIQTIVSVSSCIVTNSSGRLFTAYRKSLSGTFYLVMAYSDNDGATWTEVTEIDSVGKANIKIAIDSMDIIHVVYFKSSYIITYRTFSSGAWNAEQTIFDGTSDTDDVFGMDLAIDSSDFPHVAWTQYKPATTNSCLFYSNRSGGSWAARTQLTDSDAYSGANINPRNVKMVLDSSNFIWIFFTMPLGIGAAFGYSKYETFWTGPTILEFQFAANTAPSAVVLSNDNVHVITSWSSGVNQTRDWIYTESTDSWAGTTIVASSSGEGSLGRLVDNTLYGFWGTNYRTYNGSWSGTTAWDTGTDSSDSINTPLYPILTGVNTQIPTAGYQITFIDNTLGNTLLRIAQSSDLDLQVPQTKNYSRASAAALSSTDANLSNLFTSAEYTGVATADSSFVTQTATDQYSVFEFKNKGNASTDNIVVTWIGQSNIAPTTSPVYLQIYNRNSSTWETLDSNNSALANTNFPLTGSKTSSLSNYYDGSNWVSCRVYQLAA